MSEGPGNGFHRRECWLLALALAGTVVLAVGPAAAQERLKVSSSGATPTNAPV